MCGIGASGSLGSLAVRLLQSRRPLWAPWLLLWAWGGAVAGPRGPQVVYALLLTVDAALRPLTGPLPG